MNTAVRARNYDIFKTIVLIILFLLLLWLACRTSGALSADPPPTVQATASPSPGPTATPDQPTHTASATASVSPVVASHTPTLQSGVTGAELTITPTQVTELPDETTPTPDGLAAGITPTGTSGADQTVSTVDCPGALPSRLSVPGAARILYNLNLRSSPGIDGNLIRTNVSGIKVEIIGGPQCLSHEEGAYVWWQIRLVDGTVGWSAEGALNDRCYYLEPTR